MILPTKSFFNLIRIHYRLPPGDRPADLLGRLSLMADPANSARLRIDDLTRRCLRLFLGRRVHLP